MSWAKETPEDIKKLQEEYRKNPDYYDDGALLLTCKFCGSKEAILSAPCCEEREKIWNEQADSIAEVFKKAFKDDLD
jgi:hypothetical protein